MYVADTATRPDLEIAAMIAATNPGARRVAVEEVVADALGARAAFAVDADGAVRVAFGAVEVGVPTVPLVPARVVRVTDALDSRAVGAYLVNASELRQQLGIDLGSVDLARIAEILRQRALARRAELERAAADGAAAQRAATVNELARAERRAALLRELSTMDSESPDSSAEPSTRRGWWSR
ncbi:hypothetical protein GCM10022247_56830 [Allokutzneria multivorans]|uniref:Uncharacterized protein n=2 Tax=Allokutzneria multivorans TaxID=1142134 RepID=A0ABP7TEK2_9PSEU